MKRLFILAAFAAVAFGLKAEVSTTTYAIVPAVNATAVTAGTATTNTLDVSHYTGTGEIIAPYSTANTSCVFSVTLEGTNTTDGGWSVISTNNATGYLSGVVRIPFMAAGLPPTIRVSIGATAANANGCAVFAARKE